MIEITYEKHIPFPFDVVLSQYFDYEHIAHVHPTTLGEYQLLEQSATGIVYEQIWPESRLDRLLGRRRTSRVIQRFLPPNVTTFEFVAGLHKGTEVHSTLLDQDGGTLVLERYRIPGLPNWALLRRMIKPLVMRTVNRVWDEDLRVEVCRGGWPGVPDAKAASPAIPGGRAPVVSHDIGRVGDFRINEPRGVKVGGTELLIVRRKEGWSAFSNHCPHTGGPLALGRVRDGAIVCPWHGAAFDLKSGHPCPGFTLAPLIRHNVVVEGDRVGVTVFSSE